MLGLGPVGPLADPSRPPPVLLGGGRILGLRASPQILLSGGFGSGHREGVIGEVGDELQVPAECLDVAGDGLDG